MAAQKPSDSIWQGKPACWETTGVQPRLPGPRDVKNNWHSWYQSSEAVERRQVEISSDRIPPTVTSKNDFQCITRQKLCNALLHETRETQNSLTSSAYDGCSTFIENQEARQLDLANVSNLDSVVCKGACVFLNSHGERIVHLKA